MSDRCIAFDVETPNAANDRISSIGITVMEEGHIVEEFSSLVNPETQFHAFNIELTKITPDMVQTAPTFAQLWPKLEPIFSSGLLLAHNAQFDMSVLAKVLHDYRIPWKHQTHYACTCQMAKRSYPELPNHRLNTLCDHLGIALDHHQAASDSRACALIFLDCIKKGWNPSDFLRTYDLVRIRTIPRKKSTLVSHT